MGVLGDDVSYIQVGSNFMKEIQSRRHPFKFYLSILFGSLFFLALGTALLFIFFKELNSGELKPKVYFLPLASLCVYILAFYTVYKYFKNAPIIKLDEQVISIGNTKYYWSNVKKIELSGKWNFPYILYFPMEAFEIIFNNGTSKVIFDDMYSNSWEIKSFIKFVILEKNQVQSIKSSTITYEEVKFDNFEIFKGNQFTSLRGISLWSVIGFFILLMLSKNKVPEINAIIFLTSLSLLWFILHSYMMNYFMCSNNYFIIKNHNLLWKSKIFKLSEIKEIVFETQGKQPNSLRVITKDFRNKLYLAGTLRDHDWLELKSKLEKNNIQVRNECIPEN